MAIDLDDEDEDYLSLSKLALRGRLYLYSRGLFKYIYFDNTIFDEML